MFLSSLEAYIVIPVIAVVVAQYAFALFCLMKLAYLDVSRKYYVLWNLFILIVFFIGGVVFLVYFNKHPELLIEKTPRVTDADKSETDDSANESSALDENTSTTVDDSAEADKTSADEE